METVFAWVALGIGLVVSGVALGIALLGPSSERISPQLSRGRLWLAGLIAAAAFCLTLPVKSPFSSGQALGPGFAVGAVIALLAAWLLTRLRAASPAQGMTALLGLAGLTLIGVSVVHLLFAGGPVHALSGFALGACVVAALVLFSEESEGSHALPLQTLALFAATLAVAEQLGVFRFNNKVDRVWWVLPLLVSGFALLGGLVGCRVATFLKRPGAGLAAAGGIAAIFLIGLSIPLALKTYLDPMLLVILALGLVLGGLVAWLGWGSGREAAPRRLVQAGAAVGLLTLFFGLVAFKFLGAFGFSLMLLASFGLFLLLTGDSLSRGEAKVGAGAPPVALAAIAFGVGYLLLRLFIERQGGQLIEEQLRFHYTAIGLLAGAFLPFLLAAHAGTVWRMGSAGLAAAAAPGVVMVLWGAKATLGFLAGIAITPALLLLLIPAAYASSQASAIDELVRSWSRRMPLLTVAMGLVAVQFSQLLLPFYQTARLHKIILAGAVAFIFVGWLIMDVARQPRRAA